jgi:translation initiation factor IF-2
MTERNDQDREKKTLSLSPKGKLQLNKTGGDANQVRQSFSHGRSKAVTVEVKRKRAVDKPGARSGDAKGKGGVRGLTDEERESRMRALKGALAEQSRAPAPSAVAAEAAEPVLVEEEAAAAPAPLDAQTRRRVEEDERLEIEREEAARRDEESKRLTQQEADRKQAQQARIRAEQVARGDAPGGRGPAQRDGQGRDGQGRDGQGREGGRSDRGPAGGAGRGGPATRDAPSGRDNMAVNPPREVVAAKPTFPAGRTVTAEDDDAPRRKAGGGGPPSSSAPSKAPATPKPNRNDADRRRGGVKMTVTDALSGDEGGRVRSLAAFRRAREKERRKEMQNQATQPKFVREVQIPDVITVQELANRMATRAADVIKHLMRNNVMATINQTIDSDTAQLIVEEFGHTAKRVSESDVELVLNTAKDIDSDLRPRPPVVTIMGHVDHGKTSLLDALRQTDVAGREAGGITQHIGAYQVALESGGRITFIDTPGHAAFTAMRARGANVTDIVVLVVAANDGVMPQTVEAISHAKAANVPLIVAINKCDLPDARPDRVLTELLQYSIVTEAMGGEVMAVQVSAKTKLGLAKLEEAILLQAEILELRANPDRLAEGAVIEAKLERGRGSVATVLVQRGTLRVGDAFVVGAEFGRVRALVNDRGEQLREALPGMPVELIGLNGTPQAGDVLTVVEDESKAREIAEYRHSKLREVNAAATARGTLEQMFSQIREGEAKQFPVVIKGDVQGSIEAIVASLEKLTADHKEVKVQVLFSGVGAITESDITLANASKALIIAFNVRANPQAREASRRDGVEIRYYSIIYNVIDEVKAALSGLLSPEVSEEFIGYASIRQVFNITKVGKVGGCMITEGTVKRGAGVRLLRENVVVHTGTLKTLKRFKDEVREVREGFECGIAFENYEDIREGDIVECYEIKETKRTL